VQPVASEMRPYRSRPLWATQHRAVESDLRADRQPLVALNLGPSRTTGRLGDATLPVPTAPGDATRSGGGSDLRADRQPLVGLNLGPHRATGRLGDATLPVPTALGDATRSGGRVRSPSGPSAIGRLECCKTHHFLRNMFLKTKTPQDVSIRTSGLRYW